MWNTLIIYPFTNALLFLYTLVGNNFTLAIAIFTVIIRLVTIPLTLSSQRNQKRMTELQPKIKELQEKFKDQPEKLNAELAAIGFGPSAMLGGCLPMLIQFPVLIGLYQSITYAMAVTPLSLVDLYSAIYPFFPNFNNLIPVQSQFLWLNLALPDPFYVLPVLVFATTWLSQKMVTPPTQPGQENSQAAEMTRSMGIMMPVMFGFMSLSFASGLSIYFVVSNLATMVQYGITDDNQRARIWALLRGQKPPQPIAAGKTGGKTGGKAAKASAKK